ncbi:hypothetical protein [Bradyrhizobium sp. USDA 3364]
MSDTADHTLEDINDHIAEILREEAKAALHADRRAEIDAAVRADRAPMTAMLVGADHGEFGLIIRSDPNDKANIARAHAAIARKYRDDQRPRLCRRGLVAVRIEEFERYMAHRYGRTLPDDAGRHDLTILLNHIAQAGDIGSVYCRMRGTAKVWARCTVPLGDGASRVTYWMSDTEMDELIALILKRPRRYTAKKLGELTGLTEAEHKLLGITSWWPHTWNTAEVRADQRERRKTNDREAKKAKRRGEGAVTREEYLAQSKSRTEPWLAAGFKCRRTWERHIKKAAALSETQECRKSVASVRKDSYRAEQPATRPIRMRAISPTISHLDGIDFERFGIVAIKVMSRTRTIREWCPSA